MSGEKERLERLRSLFGGTPLPSGVRVGIGDDAAVLAPVDRSIVWTIDAAVEGVHFRRDWMSLEQVGWRSIMAAASDVAAMGAAPLGVLSALILPTSFGDEDLGALARGQADAARALGTAVLGGNLSSGQELSITTCVLGEAASPVLRAGAKAGDIVALAGTIGLAAAGLEALKRGAGGLALAPAEEAYRRPRARMTEGLTAARLARSGIDLSDGLALDASRLATESGIGIVLQPDRLLAAAGPVLGAAAAALSLDPLELVLYGGEDYALLMTFPSEAVATGFVPIGRCIAGSGIWIELGDGTRREIEPRGFDHFAGR
jgi:thiamine-monophosphate kinase